MINGLQREKNRKRWEEEEQEKQEAKEGLKESRWKEKEMGKGKR